MKPALDSKYEIAKPNYCCTVCEVETACGSPYYSAIFSHAGEFARRDFCEPCWDQHVSGAPSESTPEPEGDAVGESEAVDVSEAGAGDLSSVATADEPAGDDAADQVIVDAPPYAFWRTRRSQLATDQPRRVRFDVDLALQFFRGVADHAANEESAVDSSGDETTASGAGVGDTGAEVSADDAVNASGVASDLDTSEASVSNSQEGEPSDSGLAAGTEERDQLGFVVALLLIRKKVLTLDSTAARDGQEYLKVTERKEPRTSSWIRNPELTPPELERVKVRLSDLLHMQV